MPVMIGTFRTTAMVAAIALGATACAGGGDGGSSPPPAPSAATQPSTTSTPPTVDTATIPDVAPTLPPTTSAPAPAPAAMRAVSLVDRLIVFDRPAGAGVAEVPAATAFGTPTVLGMVEPAPGAAAVPGWVQVLLPMRPNGSSGWVRAGEVRLEPVHAEVHIDLATRTLRFVEHGSLVGQWPVAIGTPDRPTPTGRFFVTDKLATGDPDSVWGNVALGISAFSGVLTDFIGGIGQIGVHGTNNPDSIGRAASSGCIRLPNEVIEALIDRLPLGTPVHIT